MTQRNIEITGTGVVMELSKATSINTPKNMIHFDQLDDGTWRLTYNRNMIPDFTKVEAFTILRKD
jgi:hypothetical protein